MKRVLTFLLVLFCFHLASAQYTEIINSKRPGFSESPYSVGTNIYQLETGLFYRNNDNPSILTHPNIFGTNLQLRYGKFSEKLEFNLNLAYQVDEIRNPLGKNVTTQGISDLTIGAKYLIRQQEFTDNSTEIRSYKKRMAFDWKRLIPSVGVYAGVHTPFISKDYKDDNTKISYKLAVLLQNDITDRFVLLTNLIADNYSSDDEFYAYIVTMTYAINQRWSYFVENQGRYQDLYAPQYQFGTGLAYLVNENLQIDASARTNFFDDYSYYYFSTGFSWRLDRHYDTFKFKAAPDKSKKKKKKRKGFFGRLFDKLFH
ncbi:transporter [Lutibacter citreus]|uniref:transporter n=1 Tax=Lutibacter citreus TaxID=2138210 RepID=UPI000DBE598A|nr:transporter [Lutibacter citreus]